jgi:pilus assembly protein Flp/PilA
MHSGEAKMKNVMKKFFKNESGATAIEYGLIAALIAVAIIGAVSTLGTDLATTFGDVSAELTGAGAPAAE